MKVTVRDNDVNGAIKVLVKKMQREGLLKDMRRTEFFEKPSERRVRESREAIRRERKRQRKAFEVMGF